ncbi:hypothetical protein ACQPYH_06320 [Kribbella sp. CA-245084]|uniref:hypothetical protein n=1 Tax=Kribbella sp. CA-245084 TaxID=3239940 RepID=UPI003D939897
MTGGDLAGLDALSAKLKSFAEELAQLKGAASKVVVSTQWTGRHSNDFRAAWTQCQKNIGLIETDLANAASAVQKNRQAITIATGGQ